MAKFKIGDTVVLDDRSRINHGCEGCIDAMDSGGEISAYYVKCTKGDFWAIEDHLNPVEYEELKDTSRGLRHNKGKIEVHQVPTSLINGVAQVLMFGATKYERNNWRKGMNWTIPYDCLQRHMMKWLDGEEVDDESGLSHLYHAACNIAMLIEFAETCPELDDRFKGKLRDYSTFKKEE